MLNIDNNLIFNKIIDLTSSSSNPWRKIDLYKCRRINSFQKLQRNSEIKLLQEIFNSSLLNARMGYNIGSQDLSFTISLPTIKTHSLDDLYKLWNNNPKTLIIWFMLGISPIQHNIQLNSNINIANDCLSFFKLHTTLTICGRFIDLSRNTIRIILCPHEDTLDPSTGRIEYIYSPSYSLLNGIEDDLSKFSLKSLEKQKHSFITSMIEYFWKDMEEKQKYMAVDTLYKTLTNSLKDFFKSGLDGQSQNFNPPYSTPFYFYLYGTAGIGKSAFVKAFSISLQNVLQYYIDPYKIVNIVKIPLNAFTSGNLRGILRVKGISDMSIERIIEQTLCKGGIIIFHLEENPDDPSLQEKLFIQTQKMLDSLVKRYPEYRAHILTIITSNYPPCSSILELSHLLTITAPGYKQQFKWCYIKLKDSIQSFIKSNINIDLDIQVKTPYVEDLRPLEQWWRSIAFSISDYLLKKNIKTLTIANNTIKIQITGVDGSYKVFFQGVNWETLLLSSHNGFFYCIQNDYRDDTTILDKYNLNNAYYGPILSSLIKMTTYEYLQPAVIVLIGNNTSRKQYCSNIYSYLYNKFNNKLHYKELELLTEDDKSKVFGEPKDILGGLFRFIDNVNNPNACNGETDRFGLIISNVNEIGQFILRELLEPGDSKTHRQRAKKNRLLFVVSLLEYSQLTPQVHSRSHFIIQC